MQKYKVRRFVPSRENECLFEHDKNIFNKFKIYSEFSLEEATKVDLGLDKDNQ